jgi:hypothetical protein
MLAVPSKTDHEIILMPEPKRPETPSPPTETGRRLTAAKLAAVVEAAYILDAVRR